MQTKSVTGGVTKEKYFRLAAEGEFEGRRVELVAGEIVDMSPQENPHSAGVVRTQYALQLALGPNSWPRAQMTLDLSPNSCPEPDVAVVPGTPLDYVALPIPTTALLVVEVSDSTLRTDHRSKMSLYAASGIVEYWILNVPEHQLEVYCDPVVDASRPFGFRYDQMTVLHAGDFVSPLALPAATIPVADLIV